MSTAPAKKCVLQVEMDVSCFIAPSYNHAITKESEGELAKAPKERYEGLWDGKKG